jgi:hypothetical protein
MTIDVGTGTDRLMGVALLQRGTTLRSTSGSFNGVSLSSSGSSENLVPSTKLRSDIFYIINPASGSNTLSIVYSGGSVTQYECQVSWYEGVSQSGSFNFISGSSGQSASAIVTLSPNVDGCLLLGTTIHETLNALTSGSDQTTIYNNDNGAWVTSSAYKIQTTAQSQQMLWTGASDYWASAGVVFEPASSNVPPTVVLNTSASSVFNDTTPTLEFTGSDDDDDDIRYQIQISDNNTFLSGSNLRDNHSTGGGGNLHENGMPATTWEGYYQVDDRFGQSFKGAGGILDTVSCMLNTDEIVTVGSAIVKIYGHQGTYGTSGCPLNAVSASSTPTPGWLAISDSMYINWVGGSVTVAEWMDFTFSGENRIRLQNNVPYFMILDWRPDSGVYENLIKTIGDTGLGHAGNAYVDGASESNNGVRTDFDLLFRIYEENTLLSKISGSDSGFLNTVDGGDSDPFSSGSKISFTVQAGDALSGSATYFWRVRGIDPDGSNIYGEWSEIRSFFVESSGSSEGTTLTVADSDHAHTADSPSLTQAYAITVADSDHAQTADSPTLTQAYAIVVADSDHAHTADNITLNVGMVLVVVDSDHAQTSDSPTLTQAYALTVADSDHAQTADSPTLTQAYAIVVADSDHVQTADNITLSAGLVLAVADSDHAQTADSPTLTQAYAIVVADSDHVQTADNITLSAGLVLAVADSDHAQTVDNLELTQNYSLSVSDTNHIHTSDNVDLTHNMSLVVFDSDHSHNADNITTIQGYSLLVNDSSHEQTSDVIGFIQAYLLVVLNTTHTQSVDNIDFIPEITGWVELTLKPRTTNFTLSYRSILFTLKERDQ